MIPKYLIGQIGSSFYFISTLIFVFLPHFMYFNKIMLSIFFLIISFSVISIGIGLFELFLNYRVIISLFSTILSLIVGFFSIISFLTIIPLYNTLTTILLRYEVWFILYVLMDCFFILISITLMIHRKINKTPIFSGIIILIFSVVHLIFSVINFNNVFDYLKFRYSNIDFLTIKLLIKYDINDALYILNLYIKLNNPLYHSIFLLWHFSLFFLGLSNTLIGIFLRNSQYQIKKMKEENCN